MLVEKVKYCVLCLFYIYNNFWLEGLEIEYDGVFGLVLELLNEVVKEVKVKVM